MWNRKTFDAKTARKIITDYAERINILTIENQTLKKQLEDANTSLKINKEILFSHFTTLSSSSRNTNPNSNTKDRDSSLISTLEKENTRLSEKINWLFSEKTETSKWIYKWQQQLEDIQWVERTKQEKEKSQKFIEDNKWTEKDNKINAWLKQIEKYKTNTDNNTKIQFIGDPNKLNVEMNNELMASRAILKKYTALLQREKGITMRLNVQIRELENTIKSSNNPNWINKHNITEVNVMDCLFSETGNEEDEDEDDIDGMDNEGGDDTEVKFPDKIQYELNKTVENTKGGVPKLDWSTLLNNYTKPDNVQIVNNNKNKPANNSNRSTNNEYTEKWKAQIKIFKSTISKYKERIKKWRDQVTMLRNKNTILENTINLKGLRSTVNETVNETCIPNYNEDSEREDPISRLNKNITKKTDISGNMDNDERANDIKEVNM